MFRSVCLNNFVIYLVSLPTYVKVAHVLFVEGFRGLGCGRVEWGPCVGVCGKGWDLHGRSGKELLCKMLWMISFSLWCSVSCSW
jgi:hypothetical protein